MSEVYVKAVRSNIDALDERRLHDALVRMVQETTSGATTFLRADRALHSRTGLTEEHIREERVEEIAGLIRSKLGVTPVVEKDVGHPTYGSHRKSDAPLFVEGGTRSPIFPAVKPAMWNRSEGIFGRKAVRGQTGQHFMLRTYQEARALLREDKQIADALRVMDAEAAVMKAAIEAS